MRISIQLQSLAIALVALGLAGGARANEEPEEQPYEPRRFYASAGIGFDYNSGDYGESEKTDIYSSSLFAKLEYEPITLKVSVPYVVIDGPENVLPDGSTAGSGADSSLRHGIGDVVTTLTYTYFSETKYVPIVDASTKVKIPTASTKQDIGTGKTDVTLGLEVTEVLGRVSVFGSAGYRFKGGSEFKDIWLASVGTNVRLGRVASVGFAYDFREASTSAGDSHEIAPFASFRLSDHWRFGPYGVFGLSKNSPDWGVGGMFTVNL